MSREYTREECTQKFYDHLRAIFEYWLHEDRTPDVKEKLSGAMFSMLVLFDGCSALGVNWVLQDGARILRRKSETGMPVMIPGEMLPELMQQWHQRDQELSDGELRVYKFLLKVGKRRSAAAK